MHTRFLIAAGALALAVAAFAGGFAFERVRGTDEARMTAAVREALLTHPEILPEAMDRLRQKETARALESAGKGLTNAYPGAVLGNPAGTTVLVEFTDYACTYCRRSLPDVQALIAADPQLKIVTRELPILGPGSVAAARVALLAARQGKYAAFHDAMFAMGPPTQASISAAARKAGVDTSPLAKRDPAIEGELARNLDFARQLGIGGTPAWIVGDQVLSGAIGREALARALAEGKPA
ncbi:DsbA family protein [Parablastomonas sp. CN1-191]|uniref:DsbA family protein n=1 Tax=Parablastomonas sp. CN1-191 TaxID=3400908 RepID=UPI003BF83D1B